MLQRNHVCNKDYTIAHAVPYDDKCPFHSLSSANSGANPNEEGNTIMNEKGWKVDSGHVNLQDEGQTMDATYEDEMPPHSSSPHSIVRQSSR